ncbi:MAG: carboxypeptidase regulatory-like domain-containing protein, partial [Acidobacteriota bacterium]|nr:carboxypeptidase regulatory-like domain-containing protein [Acidobacteriota bacterium]
MFSNRLTQLFFLSLSFVAVSSFCAMAQEITGSIIGTIQDATGSFVPGAKIDVRNTDRNLVVRSVTSGSNGEYTATLLPIGHYTVSVEAPGFKKASKTGVELNVNDKLTMNFALEVGAVSEEVTVQSNISQVETQSAEASNLITGTQVRELALNTRNYVQLVTLLPGVTTGGNDQVYVGVSAPAGTSNQTQFAVNGARISQNNWTIDGADNVDRGANLTLLNYPSVDAIAEFRVLRGLYTAEFGRAAGGQINVITKSGTSGFHGDLYEFVRNNAFAANNFFNNRNRLNLGTDGNARVPPLRYNNFGYTVGGPVYIPKLYNKDKNKTFFFFSQEFRRVITYTTLNGTAPTAAEKQGIFPNPVCTSFSLAGTCLTTGTQVTNINPVAAQYIKDIFSKLPDGVPGTNALFTALRNVFNARQELYKIDHVFSQKLAISGRYLQDTIPTIEPGGLFTGSPYPNLATTNTNAPGKSFTFRATSSFSPTWLNEAGYFYSYGAVTNTVAGLDNATLSPDIKVNLPYPTTLGRIPTISLTGGSGIASFGPYADFNRNHTVFDNMSKILGRHTLKFGFTYNHYQKTENNGNANTGSFSFSNTGKPAAATSFEQGFASFLSGYVSSFSQASVDYAPFINANQAELYVQDDFHFRPNFTLNVGLRYSLFRAPTEGSNNLS